jgi:melanoma-associated antigen
MQVTDSESQALLTRMIKEGYLAKFAETANGEERIEYTVGPRGKVQVGEDGVRSFVQSVWQADGAEQPHLAQALDRTLNLTNSTRQVKETANGNGEQRGPGRPRKRKNTHDEDSDEDIPDAESRNDKENSSEADSDEDDSGDSDPETT